MKKTPSKTKKTALVLSGGGAKGAFQFGAEKYARSKGYKWDVIAGVSVGALNGTMLAMEKYAELENVWNNISDDKIYGGGINFWSILKLFFGSKSFYNNKPLWDLINKEIDPTLIKKDLRIGAVSLETGEFISFRSGEYDKDTIRKILLASIAIPIVWPSVDVSEKYKNIVDGGLRNISPLGDILDSDPTEVIIINCNQDIMIKHEGTKNILDIAKYSIEIMMNEIFVSDVREFIRINDAVKEAARKGVILHNKNKKPYKYYKYKIIEPEEILGDSLDFSQATAQKNIKKGMEQAKKVLG